MTSPMTQAAPVADRRLDTGAPGATQLGTFMAMMARELRVIRRSFVSTFTRVVMQPLLFVFVFAYVLPKIGGSGPFGGHAGSAGTKATFSTILVPGMVASALLMQGVIAVTFPLIAELSWERTIEDRVLAPLPVPLLGLQKIAAGGLQALIGGVLVFPIVLLVHAGGQAPNVHISNWPLFLFVFLTGGLASSALGLFLGTAIDPRQMQVLFAVILLPATMLGCVYYPWAALHSIRWLQILVLVNPMVYMSEGLRAALTPQVGHMATWAFLLALAAGTVGLTLLATRTFTRRVLT
jgi:ABC-type multidrug transport system permease subunit